MKIFLILLFILTRLPGYSQPGPVFGDKGTIDQYWINEKIGIETDRELYMAGEDMNFACISFEPFVKKMLDLSKVVYVEFYTSANQVIDQIKIEMIHGSGGGVIKIPKRLSSGRYYVRAYSNYMKNFGCEGFSYCSVTVLNPFQEVSSEEEINHTPPFLRECLIYPEGGQIVYGFSNRVSCEFTDNNGRPVQCNARLLDSRNQVLTAFTSNEYGSGSFQFTPHPGASYTLEVESSDGASGLKKKIDIPDQSVSLVKLNQDQDKLRLKILRYHYDENLLRLETWFSNTSALISTVTENDSIIVIPLNILPKGIIEFRLRNSTNEIVSCRNIYISTVQKMEFQIQTNKESYGNRETVELTLAKNPVNTEEKSISVSVFMIEPKNLSAYKKSDNQASLYSVLYPLLAGSPYPANNVISNDQFLDQVLIAKKQNDTASMRPETRSYSDFPYFPEYRQDLICGTVVDGNNIPVPSFPLMQTWIDTVSTMQTAKTDKEGRFFFETSRSGENKLILTHNKTHHGRIVLQEEFFTDFFPLAEEKIFINPENIKVLNQQMLNLQINDSYYEKIKVAPKENYLPFYVNPDKLFRISDYVTLLTLEEFLFEVVPGILPYHSGNKTIIRMHFPQMDVSFGDDPLFLVDGVPVFDADLIGKLKCADIISVGVVYEKFFYQHENFDGILDIHTRKGDASILSIPESVNSFYFTGLQATVFKDDFFIHGTNSAEPYFKTQLYWNPSVKLNRSGKAILTFKTPDNNGDYLVRCSLKSPDGSVAYFYCTFNVK